MKEHKGLIITGSIVAVIIIVLIFLFWKKKKDEETTAAAATAATAGSVTAATNAGGKTVLVATSPAEPVASLSNTVAALSNTASGMPVTVPNLNNSQGVPVSIPISTQNVQAASSNVINTAAPVQAAGVVLTMNSNGGIAGIPAYVPTTSAIKVSSNNIGMTPMTSSFGTVYN